MVAHTCRQQSLKSLRLRFLLIRSGRYAASEGTMGNMKELGDFLMQQNKKRTDRHRGIYCKQ